MELPVGIEHRISRYSESDDLPLGHRAPHLSSFISQFYLEGSGVVNPEIQVFLN